MTAMIAWRTRESKKGLIFRSIAAGIIHAVIAFTLTEATFSAASHSLTSLAACLVWVLPFDVVFRRVRDQIKLVFEAYAAGYRAGNHDARP